MNSYYMRGLQVGGPLDLVKKAWNRAEQHIRAEIRKEAADGATQAVAPVARREAAKGARSAVVPLVIGGLGVGTLLVLIARK